jgi:ABC-type uncharacterized transport system substrate-binding protein
MRFVRQEIITHFNRIGIPLKELMVEEMISKINSGAGIFSVLHEYEKPFLLKRAEISEARKNKTHLKINRKIQQLNKETLEVVNVFDNAEQAADAVGTMKQVIYSAISDKASAKGYKWCYKTN